MAKGQGRVLLVLLLAVVALAVGEVMLARGMKGTEGEDIRWTETLVRAIKSPWIWAGAGLLLVHLILYMLALSKADLSFALPMTALSYPLSALLAQAFLAERVGPARWLGTALIAAGVAVVGLGEAMGRR
ncbi:MAG TPA: EamA family transporter [Isosphaeraceae bacterium]|nr:EamA family transporter [Isosphaeraceae bacterium]